jgi:3-oxoacyl-[acyl-carrier protein] reductase
MELNGTVSIVTGGNGGLGQRICVALAAAGSKVAVVYAASREQAEAFAAELRAEGAEAEAFQCDVSDPAQVESLVSSVEAQLGGPDILVNDAAYNKMIQFDDLEGLTYEEWCKILDINLTGPMLTTKAVAPGMRKRGRGRIVNISSIAGFAPSGSSIAYAVSKAGLNHLTRCMAVGLAPEILVNCIAPGHLHAAFTGHFPERTRDLRRRAAPLGTEGTAWDIAWAAVFLASDESRWISGVVLPVDGGLLAAAPLTAYGYIENVEYW